MKAIIDRAGCIECGICAATCPEVFRIANDGKAEVKGSITPKNDVSAREAADSCPVNVITIE